MDRHELWRRVEYDYEQLRKFAPDGYEPKVEVFLVGRAEPVEPAFVETRRGADEPWIRFQSSISKPPDDPSKMQPDDYWVHVHENYVERVEIRFKRTGEKPAPGFAAAEAANRDEDT
jgi:hypothetical protein